MITQLSALLEDKLQELKQAYTRLAVNEVCVNDKEIRISGSKSALARAASHGLDNAAPGVLSFVQDWRTAPSEDENYIYAIAL